MAELLDEVAQHIVDLRVLLARPELAPDPEGRRAAPAAAPLADAAALAARLHAALPAALADGDADAELRERVAERVAAMSARLAVLHHLAADAAQARALLERAAALAPTRALRAEYTAGAAELQAYAGLHRAAWLHAAGREREARAAFRAVARAAAAPALREAARDGLARTLPVGRPPAPSEWLGVGTRLHDRRAAREDRSYRATYSLTLLGAPVLPLRAYRLRPEGGEVRVVAREPLTAGQRAWQAGVVGLLLVVAVAGTREAWLRSDHVRAGEALARAAEAGKGRDAALEAYRALATDFPARAEGREAAAATVRLGLERLARPCTRASATAAARLAAGFEALPKEARAGAPAQALAGALSACAAEVPADDIEGLAARADLLAHAAAAAKGEPAGAELARARDAARLASARALSVERPVDALRALAPLVRDAEAWALAHAVARALPDAPALWAEAATPLSAWAAAAGDAPAHQAAAAAVRTRVQAAVGAVAADAALLEGGDESALRAALARTPGHHALAVALAAHLRERGQAAEGLAVLRALGPPGRLTGAAQAALGAALAAEGHADEAARVLRPYVTATLPLYADARRRHDAQHERFGAALSERARAGRISNQTQQALRVAGSDAERERIWSDWARGERAKDADLAALGEELAALESVVPATLRLATLELQRAAGTAAPARDAHLAEAERLFLAIREEAEGQPRFHLGMGSVLHRLGRAAEGDAEFATLLERKDPWLTLEVARAYRELSLEERARELAAGVNADASDTAARYAAAALRVSMADDTDEMEEWLERCDPADDEVQAELHRARAYRHLERGEDAQAEALLAGLVARDAPRVRESGPAANNSAMVSFSRYEATGDEAHLRAAVRLMEQATRLEPDNALLQGHLADALTYLGHVRVLGRWVRTPVLRPSVGEAQDLVDALARSPLRSEVLAALSAEPALRRALDVERLERALAPGKADAYARELRWLGLRDDAAGLARLRERLEALPPFDAEGMARVRREWEEGKRDGRRRKALEAQLVRARAALARAEAAGHAPTRAAALVRISDTLTSRVWLELTPASLDGLEDAVRGAAAAWPQLAGDAERGSARLLVALVRAGEGAEEVRAAVRHAARRHGLAALLDDALPASARAAVAARPELREALALLDRGPGLQAWAVARLVGDAEREREAAAVFGEDVRRHTLAIQRRLSGDLPREREEEARFLRHAPAAAAAGQP